MRQLPPCRRSPPPGTRRHPARGATRHAAPPGTRRPPSDGHPPQLLPQPQPRCLAWLAAALFCEASGRSKFTRCDRHTRLLRRRRVRWWRPPLRRRRSRSRSQQCVVVIFPPPSPPVRHFRFPTHGTSGIVGLCQHRVQRSQERLPSVGRWTTPAPGGHVRPPGWVVQRAELGGQSLLSLAPRGGVPGPVHQRRGV